jgi:hypothetical protein
VPLDHSCNPSSRGRDQEDQGSKPAWANSLSNSISRKQNKTKQNPSQQRAGGVAQGVGPEFKSQHHKKRVKIPVNFIISFFM